MGRYIDIFKIDSADDGFLYGLSMQRETVEFFARILPKEKCILVYTDPLCTNLFYSLDMSHDEYRKKKLGDGIRNQTFLLGLLQLMKAVEDGYFPDDLSKQYG